MFCKLVVFAYLCALVSIVLCKPWHSTFVLGRPDRQPPRLGEFPHVAAIGWKANYIVNWLCGGSLIWENFILTAAHCAADEDNVPPNVVRLGDINLFNKRDDRFMQQFKIVDIIRHPQHNFSSTYFDIALMKLERKVSVNNYVAPVCLWMDEEIRLPKMFAAGWGKRGFSQPMSKILLQVPIVPMNNHDCSSFYSKGNRRYRDGLKDHQFCAGENETDTCPGDSGGPLHVKLVKGRKFIPFLVGVTSFGKPCGSGAPGVYVKVSKFIDWILDTLQRYGEQVSQYMFEPMVCADRYNVERNYVSNNPKPPITTQKDSENSINFRWRHAMTSVDRNCYGTLIARNVAITLAECVFNKRPTQVALVNGEVIDIDEFIVHPLYNRRDSPYYNNIAVIKLKFSTMIDMLPVWLGGFKPCKELRIAGQSLKPRDPQRSGVLVQAYKRSAEQCRLTQNYTALFTGSSRSEHFCFKAKHTLVPGLCKIMKGSPIYKIYRKRSYVEGITLRGRDFWLKEPALGIRLSAHIEWLNSIQVTHPKSESHNVKRSDQCNYTNGQKGFCVLEKDCPFYHERMLIKQQLIFCKQSSLVCCPEVALGKLHVFEIGNNSDDDNDYEYYDDDNDSEQLLIF